MKKWNFQVKNSPIEITKNLESSLGRANGFVLNMNSNKKDIVKFKLRKRVLLAFEINAQNNIIINGKIFKTNTEKETDVEISFTHHSLSKLLIFVHIILGLGFLAALMLEAASNSYMFIFGGIILTTGILLGLHLQKIFEKNVQEYKMLISKILEI